MRYLILILILLCASCSTTKPDAVGGLQDLLEQTNPETGNKYTLEEATEIQEAANQVNEQDDWMDRLLSTPIMILFVLTAIGLVIAGGIAFQKGNIAAAIVWGCTGAAVLCLPVLLIVFFKAMMFLLYVFYGLVIVGLAVVVWKIWAKFNEGNTANASLVGSIEEIKSQLDPEALNQLRVNLKEQQCLVTKKVVSNIKNK